MQTVYGYDDTQNVLTKQQWDEATTEQRSGFLACGYLVVDDALEVSLEHPGALSNLPHE